MSASFVTPRPWRCVSAVRWVLAGLFGAAGAASALPVDVYWRDCHGTQNWTASCWTGDDGLPVASPRAGQSAYLRPLDRTEIQYHEDGEARPLARLEVGGVATLVQRGGTLVAGTTSVGGLWAGQLQIEAGLARLGDLSVGGDLPGVRSNYPASLDVQGGRVEANSLALGYGQPSLMWQSGGRIVLSGPLDIDGRYVSARVELTGGRLEASQVRSSERLGQSALTLAGGTLALSEGTVTVGSLGIGSPGHAGLLTLDDTAGDNQLRGVLADSWIVGAGGRGTLLQQGGIGSAGVLTIGLGSGTEGRPLGLYEMDRGLMGVVGMMVGAMTSGRVVQRGGQIAVQGDVTLGYTRDGDGLLELEGGQLLASRIRGDMGHSAFLQRGGWLQAETLRGLRLLHLGGGERVLENVLLDEQGTLELDGDALRVSGRLELGGTLRLLGAAPATDTWLDLFDWGQRSGEFAQVDAAAWFVPEGYRLDLSRLYLDGSLGLWRVAGDPPGGGPVPAPAGLWLALVGLALLARVRRGPASAH